MCPPGDSEFGKDAVQVPADGAMTKEQSLADLTVGKPFRWAPLSPQPLAKRRQRPCLQERVSAGVFSQRGGEESLRLIISGSSRDIPGT
jgi:hypothetical protein